jgi:N-methylhydantoinase A
MQVGIAIANGGRGAKSPGTYGDPSHAMRSALGMARDEWGVRASAISRFAHGTTTATSTVPGREDAYIGLITTEGFSDFPPIDRQIPTVAADAIDGKQP